MNRNSVTILSSDGSSLLGPVIRRFLSDGIEIDHILIDGKLSEKDQKILSTRLKSGYHVESVSDLKQTGLRFINCDHRSDECLEIIKQIGSSYLINAGTPRILKPEILTSTKGVINCHPGLLPKYQGCTCVEWAIYNDDPVGVTAHFMDEKIDTGPILLQEKLSIELNEKYESIRTRLIELTAQVLSQAVQKCFKENLSPSVLPSQSKGQYHKPISDELLTEVKLKLIEGRYVQR